MSDMFDHACAIINSAATHPDPERALSDLEMQASAQDKQMFPALWEALALKMNEDSTEQSETPVSQ